MPVTPTFVQISRTLAVAALAGAAYLSVAASAEPVSFETPTPRPAADVLPAELLRGPHFTVAPMVQNLGYMNAYTVNSDFGLFSANGDAMLRRLIREIAAIAALREIRGSEAFTSALGQAAMGSARGLKYAVTEPVATLKAVPQSIFDVFGRTQESLSREKTRYEDSSVKAALQVSSNKRDYAAKLGVDVYSTNPVVCTATIAERGAGRGSAGGSVRSAAELPPRSLPEHPMLTQSALCFVVIQSSKWLQGARQRHLTRVAVTSL